ncbi:hypothetical protein [Faecalimonas sp.]
MNEEKISIKNGDQIQIEELSIAFFKGKLEVQADTDSKSCISEKRNV